MKKDLRRVPSMELKNVQTNFTWVLTDREQIGRCLSQTFSSNIECERWVDGEKRKEFIVRSMPKFKIIKCDKELLDLVPKEEATLSIREQLLGDDIVVTETMDDLKRYCWEKGIAFASGIGYEKLKNRVEQHRANSLETETELKQNATLDTSALSNTTAKPKPAINHRSKAKRTKR